MISPDVRIKARVAIAVNLRQAMEVGGFTQEGLAAALGVSQGSVSRWLTGANTPTIETLAEIAHVMAVPVVRLVEGVS